MVIGLGWWLNASLLGIRKAGSILSTAMPTRCGELRVKLRYVITLLAASDLQFLQQALYVSRSVLGALFRPCLKTLALMWLG